MIRTLRPGGRGTEQDFGILFEQGGAFADRGRAVGKIEGCLRGAGELIEYLHHGVQRRR